MYLRFLWNPEASFKFVEKSPLFVLRSIGHIFDPHSISQFRIRCIICPHKYCIASNDQQLYLQGSFVNCTHYFCIKNRKTVYSHALFLMPIDLYYLGISVLSAIRRGGGQFLILHCHFSRVCVCVFLKPALEIIWAHIHHPFFHSLKVLHVYWRHLAKSAGGNRVQ